MSIITQGGALTYELGRLKFAGATDLTMPFSGSVVIPKAGGQTADLDTLAHEDFLHLALSHPLTGTGGARRFPSLRTMSGDVLSLSGSFLILVAQDYSVFNEFDLGALFGSGNFLTPQFPEGVTASSRPKFFVITLDGNPSLPDLAPSAHDKAFSLRSILPNIPATLGGSILAFDYSGREVEADAALHVLGPATINSQPGTLRVQLVDIWGNVLAPTDLPASAIKFSPGISNYDSARGLGEITFPTADWKLVIRSAQSSLSGVTDAERYLHRHIHIAIWPGHEFEFRDVHVDLPTLDLKEGLGAGAPTPQFLRLCLYHPSQTMQNSVGGTINEQGIFHDKAGAPPANHFRLAAKRNTVKVFNDGYDYFADFHSEVENAQSGDELYLTNWKTSAHLHLLGSRAAYDIGSEGLDESAVQDALQLMDQHRVLVHLDDNGEKFVLLSDTADRGGELPGSFETQVRRVADPTHKKEEISKGFVRKSEPFALILKAEDSAVAPQEFVARWKNVMGHVFRSIKTLSPTPTPLNVPVFPAGVVALDIDQQDPPRATVVRTDSYTNLIALLGETSTTALELAVFNTTDGSTSYFELGQGPMDATHVVLGTLPERTTAEDVLVMAILTSPPTAPETFASLLKTRFASLKYDVLKHAEANVPFAPHELAGVLRRAISRGVTVKALFWEQFLENVSVSEALLKGHSNNVELTAAINRDVAGKRGYAVLDRATRPFGSFHQKAAVLIRQRNAQKDALAWVGGMDFALGRWDTEHHFTEDPDRQRGRWWDIQVNVIGDAAVDFLNNFKQRWEALGHFIDNQAEFGSCVPRNTNLDIATATKTLILLPSDAELNPVVEPNALVQITRTFSPNSCYVNLPTSLGFLGSKGELGSLAAYKHAIEAARRFILINDQYFFSTELALDLHGALTRAKGPEFLVLMLPKDLDEMGAVDPILFKQRQRALHVLFYGGTYTPPTGVAPTIDVPRCGRIIPNAVNPDSAVLKKVALLYARNREGTQVYVHSKHMIVDDVWMIIGSSNINFRSMTYDCEINASIVGRTLFKGASGVVRSQRVELARRMLGLPAAYAPLVQDPTAMFAQFKALESKGENPSTHLHPRAPMAAQLKPDYVKRIEGEAGFDDSVDFVMALPMNHPILDFVSCNVIDADGRNPKDPLGPLASLAGAGKNAVTAYARLTLLIGCQDLVRNSINSGVPAFAEVRVSRTYTDPNGTDVTEGPHRNHLLPLEVVGTQVRLASPPAELLVALSTETLVVIQARVINDANIALGCVGAVTVDPNNQTIWPGQFLDLTIQMN